MIFKGFPLIGQYVLVSGFLRSVGSACGVKEGTQKLGRLLSLPFEVVPVVNKNDERNLLRKHAKNK